MFSEVAIRSGLPSHLRRNAAVMWFEAFEGKVGGILGRDGPGVRFIESVLDGTHVISAQSKDGTQLFGIAGFKTSNGAMVSGSFKDLVNIYGWIGALWRALPLSLLERELDEDVLLMDGITVVSAMRGQGVGTKLLDQIIIEAKNRDKKRIRLDVIDTNPRAKALYERFGFVETGREHLGIFKYVFGFSTATKMEFTLK